MNGSHAALNAPDRPAWGRGVLASYGDVTPSPTPGRRDYDLTLSRLTLRDAILIALGVAGMWGVQLATQYGMRSDIRDLGTKFENVRQDAASARQLANLAIVNDAQTAKELAELKGFLAGAGIRALETKK